MNLLVRLFLDQPWRIDDFAYNETVEFAELADQLPIESEAASIVRAFQGVPFAEQCYLQMLTAPEWDEALALARQQGRSQAEEGRSQVEEWVTMVPGSLGESGLTLPQDASTLRRISLFSRDGNGVYAVSFDPRGYSVSVGRHCSLPSKGECAPGHCGGCTSRVREFEQDGIVCVCPHGS